MKVFLPVAAAWVLMGATLAPGVDEPMLPVWQDGELAELEKSGWIPGAHLLTGEAIGDDPVEAAVEPLQVEPPKPGEIGADSAPSPVIEEKYLAAYFGERPDSFLVDPQGLLGPSDFRDRLGFLNYHASDSNVDLFVYVMGGDQEIPSEVRDEETIERFFSEGRPAAIIYYYLGAPQRSVLYLSPSLTDAISSPEQHRALESSVMQAFEKTDSAEQLERFLVQMSIRIYWMERVISGEPVTANTDPQKILTPGDAGAGEASAGMIWLRARAVELVIPGSLFSGILLVALVFLRWLRQRARYRFPEFEVEPRLGGAHAAGVGAVISFASAALPPASQRDQVPEYLRRA